MKNFLESIIFISLFFFYESQMNTINSKTVEMIIKNDKLIYTTEESGEIVIYDLVKKENTSIIYNNDIKKSKTLINLSDEKFILFGIESNDNGKLTANLYDLALNANINPYNTHSTQLSFSSGIKFIIRMVTEDVYIISYIYNNNCMVFKFKIGEAEIGGRKFNSEIQSKSPNTIECDSFDGNNIFCVYSLTETANGDLNVECFYSFSRVDDSSIQKNEIKVNLNKPEAASFAKIEDNKQKKFILCFTKSNIDYSNPITISKDITIYCQFYVQKGDDIQIGAFYTITKVSGKFMGRVNYEQNIPIKIKVYDYSIFLFFEIASDSGSRKSSLLYESSIDLGLNIQDSGIEENAFDGDQNIIANDKYRVIYKRLSSGTTTIEYFILSIECPKNLIFQFNNQVSEINIKNNITNIINNNQILIDSSYYISFSLDSETHLFVDGERNMGGLQNQKFVNNIHEMKLKYNQNLIKSNNYYIFYNKMEFNYRNLQNFCLFQVLNCYEPCSDCNSDIMGTNENHQCKNCITNYFRYENGKNEKGFYNCYSKDDPIVEEGFYFDNDFFYKCDISCKKCENNNTCINCNDGYYFKNNSVIINLITNRYKLNDICYNSLPEHNYYLNTSANMNYNGQIVHFIFEKCYSTCYSCVQGGDPLYNRCLKCEDGYISYEFDSSKCTKNASNCNLWEIDNNKNIDCINNCNKFIIYEDNNKNKNQCVDNCQSYFNPYETKQSEPLLTYNCSSYKLCVTLDLCKTKKLKYDNTYCYPPSIGCVDLDTYIPIEETSEPTLFLFEEEVEEEEEADTDKEEEEKEEKIEKEEEEEKKEKEEESKEKEESEEKEKSNEKEEKDEKEDNEEEGKKDEKEEEIVWIITSDNIEIRNKVKFIKMFNFENIEYSNISNNFVVNQTNRYVIELKKELEAHIGEYLDGIDFITSSSYKDFTITFYPINAEYYVYKHLLEINNLCFINFTKYFKENEYQIKNQNYTILISLIEHKNKNLPINSLNYFAILYDEVNNQPIKTINMPITSKNTSDYFVENSYILNNFENSPINEKFSKQLINIIKDLYNADKNLIFYNKNSQMFNDICYVFTSEYETDMTIEDRIKEYYYYEINFCEKNCSLIRIYDKEESKNPRSLCKCNVKTTLNIIDENYSFNKKDSFEKKVSNFNALKCGNEVFSKDKLSSNPLFWVFIIILCLEALVMINILCCGKTSIENLLQLKKYDNKKENINNTDKNNINNNIDNNDNCKRVELISNNDYDNNNNNNYKRLDILSKKDFENKKYKSLNLNQNIKRSVINIDDYKKEVKLTSPKKKYSEANPNKRKKSKINSKRNVKNKISVNKNSNNETSIEESHILSFNFDNKSSPFEDIYDGDNLIRYKKNNYLINEKSFIENNYLVLGRKQNIAVIKNNLKPLNQDELNKYKLINTNYEINEDYNPHRRGNLFISEIEFKKKYYSDGEDYPYIMPNNYSKIKNNYTKKISKFSKLYGGESELSGEDKFFQADNLVNSKNNLIDEDKSKSFNNQDKKSKSDKEKDEEKEEEKESDKEDEVSKSNKDIIQTEENGEKSEEKSDEKSEQKKEEENEEKNDIDKNMNIDKEIENNKNNIIDNSFKNIDINNKKQLSYDFKFYEKNFLRSSNNEANEPYKERGNISLQSKNSELLKKKMQKKGNYDHKNNQNKINRQLIKNSLNMSISSNSNFLNSKRKLDEEEKNNVNNGNKNSENYFISKNKNSENEEIISNKANIISTVSTKYYSDDSLSLYKTKNCINIFFEYFSKREIILSSFYNKYNDIAFFIRISTFVFVISFMFMFICLLLTDSDIHNRYIFAKDNEKIDEIKYVFKYEFSKILGGAIIYIIFKIIAIKLFYGNCLFRIPNVVKNEIFPFNERNMNKKEYNELKKSRKKYIKKYWTKSIVFVLIQIIFILVFGYISICYIGTFPNTSEGIIARYFISFIFSFIICGFICFIIIMFYECGAHSCFNFIKKIY